MAEVKINQVYKRFGEVTAVDNLDLVFQSGEFVSVLGPSGCGKTTLLRMLAGLEQPSEGEISIGDKVVNNLPPGKRDIAMVFQTYALNPHMSVAGNIEYPLKKRRLPKAERAKKVQAAAELLQLEELLTRRPRQLSGGQQQRVALGRALVRDPAVFLLDEPLSNLDAKLRAHMRAELIELHQRIGRTMIYVTHDQLEAMTMSDRIAVMRFGKLQQFASPEEIYSRPVNEFVAGFIGTPSMNFVEGDIVKAGGGLKFVSKGLSIKLPKGLLHADIVGSSETKPVKLGVRPEDVSVGSSGEEATVRVVEPTGHEVIVILDMHGNEVVVRVSPEQRLKSGENVKLQFRTEKLHFFDGTDGARLNI